MRLPRVLYLETTNRCNLKCRGCILFRGSWEPERDMTLAELAMITDQVPDLEKVYLHGIGEPLLNPEIIEMITHLKQRDVQVIFNSNGLLLTESLQTSLIQAGLDELRISLDAASPKTYQKIRKSRQFDQLTANLASFLHLQKQLQATRPKMSLWFLGTKDNISELPDFVKLAAQLDVRDIYLQRLVYFLDDSGYGVARANKTLQGADEKTSKLVRESQDLADRLGIRFNASGCSRPLACLQGDADADQPWRRCYRPATLMYITANGNVLPCCISPFSSRHYEAHILGNVFAERLAEVWSGSGYLKFRKRHQTGNPPECCRGCGVHWSL